MTGRATLGYFILWNWAIKWANRLPAALGCAFMIMMTFNLTQDYHSGTLWIVGLTVSNAVGLGEIARVLDHGA